MENLNKILQLIRPNAQYVIRNEEISEWHDLEQVQPTTQELEDGAVQLENLAYRDLRRAAYPSIGDQLDAIWKGGEDAEAMLAIVQAVKAQYPKPE